MTQLVASEILVGRVAHLDQTLLTNDAGVLDTYPQRYTELRPFVCVASDGQISTWAPLSSTFRRERLEIKDEWRVGGLEMWRDRVCYLNDGANIYIGPVGSFILASHLEKTDCTNRASMALAGVEAVRNEIERQRSRRINGREA